MRSMFSRQTLCNHSNGEGWEWQSNQRSRWKPQQFNNEHTQNITAWQKCPSDKKSLLEALFNVNTHTHTPIFPWCIKNTGSSGKARDLKEIFIFTCCEAIHLRCSRKLLLFPFSEKCLKKTVYSSVGDENLSPAEFLATPKSLSYFHYLCWC